MDKEIVFLYVALYSIIVTIVKEVRIQMHNVESLLSKKIFT